MKFLNTLLLSFISFITIGCGEYTCSCPNDYKVYLHKLFLTEYFWSDTIPKNVNYNQYSSPQDMINNLKYTPKDYWSTAITKEENDNFFNQKSGGFGFGHTQDAEGNRVVFLIRIDSPAFYAGLKRGDTIQMVNDQEATLENILEASENLDVPTNFTIYRPSSDETLDLNITSQEYTFKVTKSSTVTTDNNETVGYLLFDSFTGTATTEVDQAFDYFQAQNIEKLVIDLRYNGGGSVTTTSILLDKLLRDRDEEIQFTLAWNDDNQYKNEVAHFETDDNSLELKQIIFLTTNMTASASEIVINALKPYLGDNVVTIGSKTHGKPVGMSGKTDGTYIYYLVNFVIKNSDGFYDYFRGLGVTEGCEVEDDIYHERGSPSEGMLQKALFYIDNNHC
ncbi:MAG: hypothetical protein K0U38_06690 [Epsilonproteobacteria bacterium]|nr:hypothetical protein [Campylobacterota bacterium]